MSFCRPALIDVAGLFLTSGNLSPHARVRAGTLSRVLGFSFSFWFGVDEVVCHNFRTDFVTEFVTDFWPPSARAFIGVGRLAGQR